MARRDVFGFAVGLLTGVAGTIVLSGGHAIPRVMAQENAAQQATVQLYRYQVTPWAESNSHGAFVIDTATGELWSTDAGYSIHEVGPAWKR
jgi:hypothetical protein